MFTVNLLTLGQTVGPSVSERALCGTWRIWHAIWPGTRKTGCDGRDSAGRACTALHVLSALLIVLPRDGSDPRRQQYLATDQKVGGSNPSERAQALLRAPF
jgi:hypothetical protein